jgi:hypothetical protein
MIKKKLFKETGQFGIFITGAPFVKIKNVLYKRRIYV